jgi:ACS family hexuronate transporter-like MFS transporter
MTLVSDRPETDPRISEAERRELLEDHRCAEPGSTTPRGATVPLGHYLTQPTVLATAFAFFGYNYILFFFLSWFPSYLTTAQHLSLQRMSIVTVIPWVLGFLGLVSGGFISDFVYRRTGKALFSRKLVLVACLGGAAVCIALSGLVTGVTSAVALTAVAIFLLYLTGAIYWAIIQDIVVGENVGGVGGFMHGLANTSGIIGPAVTGFIVQWTGAFTSAFVLAGAIAILGVIGVIVFVHPIRQLGPHPAGQVPVA